MPKHKSYPRLFVLLCIAGVFVWLFSETLFGGGTFAYRDAGHFYYPLFQYVQEEWSAGRVPLWNPYENLGQPLAADATSSVFYPGKLVFAMPLGYAATYKLYILAHVLLAAWAAYRLARHFDASVAAAGICSLSYAFSGSVLFGYCNVVFLVGAAWLPLAVLAADHMLVERSPRWAIAFGAVLAMMTLGGDPQMAYNAGLLAAFYAAILWRQERRQRVGADRASAADSRLSLRESSAAFAERKATDKGHAWLRNRWTLLSLAAVTGLLLAAIQVLPSLEFARRSDRDAGTWSDRLAGRLAPGTHQEHTYHFSVGPWRLAEYVWPNAAGRQFPEHRRWLDAIPYEGRAWTPSLYMGLLPLLLAISALRFRRGEPRETWLSWTAVAAVVASFGWFAPGWLLQECYEAASYPAADCPVGAPFGGPYWLLTLALPGYASFRYPAKLLVVAALALSVLSARGFDRVTAGPSVWFRRGLLWLGGASLLGAIAALAIRPFWPGWFAAVAPDPLFGPLDAAGAWSDVFAALLQTAAVCGLAWCAFRKVGAAVAHDVGAAVALPPLATSDEGRQCNCRPNEDDCRPSASRMEHCSVSSRTEQCSILRGERGGLVVILLVAIDLALANRWLIACAPAGLWEEPSAVAAAIEQDEDADVADGTPPRVWRDPLYSRPTWQDTSAPGRLAEIVAWQRATLSPRYNLPARIAMADVDGTMRLDDYRRYLDDEERDGSACGAAGAEYVVLPRGESLSGGRRLETAAPDVSLWPRRGGMLSQRAALCEHVAHGACLPAAAPREDMPPCPPRAWIVHENADADAAEAASYGGEACRITHFDPSRVEIEATLVEPGLVVLREQFYPGWQLEVQTAGQPPRSLPIERFDRVFRGVQLPAGEHRLIYTYRPASFLWGAVLSGLGWIALAMCGARAVTTALRATRGATQDNRAPAI